MTYKEVDLLTNQYARILQNKYSVSIEDKIALIIDRSEWMILSLLAVLKSGAAYIPIDPSLPAERQDYMIKNSESKLIIIDDLSTKEEINKNHLIINNQFKEELLNQDSAKFKVNLNSGNLAYIIYTSGSTGLPKGVMIEHRNLVHIANTWVQDYKLDQFSVNLLQLASFSFDVFFGDFCRALLTGGKLVICPNDIKLDLDSLYQLMLTNQISIFESTPSMIFPLMDYIYENNLDSSFLKLLILGSDVCSTNEFNILNKRFGKSIRILNSYGTTETAIDSSFYENDNTNSEITSFVPIGKPMGNTRFYVLDENLRETPINVYGELCIGGPGVARGYINNPDLSKERFVANPFVKNEKMYRTGDHVKWLSNGNVSFLGREDNQVKIRGYRIELGEIEFALSSHPMVKEAVVIAVGDEDKTLLANIVLKGTKKIEGINEFLQKRIPDYMIPAHFVYIDEVPLTSNKKVDRKKLSELYQLEALGKKEYVAPKTLRQKTLVKIWEEVLKREKIGLTDNFFRLGGHSLKAVKTVSLIEKEFNVKSSIKSIFEFPIVEQLSAHIDSLSRTEFKGINPVSNSEYYDLSHAQKRLWILEELSEGHAGYNMLETINLTGEVSREILERSFKTVIDRHEILRTNIKIVDGEPKQFIGAAKLELEFVDLSLKKNKKSEIQKLLLNEERKPFNLKTDSPLRIHLVKLAKNECRIVLTMHHICSDAWSMDLIKEELISIYEALVNKKEIDLPKLRIQYKDYAHWHNEILRNTEVNKAKNYWINQFKDFESYLELPIDYSRPSVKTYNGSSVPVLIDSDLTEKLREVCKEEELTLFMLLIGVFYLTLSKYSNQEDIVIGTPSSGREHPDLENLIGFFVNTLALRFKTEKNSKVSDLLKIIKNTTLTANESQIYPFDELIDDLEIPKDLSRTPLFNVFFALQNKLDESIDIVNSKKNGELNLNEHRSVVSKFDLAIDAVELEKTLFLNFEYSTDLFEERTISNFANHYLKILEAILANLDTKVCEIDFLSENEKKNLIIDYNKKHSILPIPDKTLIEMFEDAVERTPNNNAIFYRDHVLTYKELNEKSNQLAHYLIEQSDLKADDFVAIFIDRSEWAIIAIIAILKTGAAYVPIDVEYPEERISYILNDSKAKLILADSSLNINKVEKFNNITISLREVMNFLERYSSSNLAVTRGLNDLLYCIYTSGSSGKPKGTLLEDLGVSNMILSVIRILEITSSDRAIQYSSLSFDASVYEIFKILLSSAELYMVSQEMRYSINDLESFMIKKKITLATLTPSVCSNMDLNKISSLRLLLSMGEEFKKSIMQNKKIQYFNGYGPTEASVCTSIFKIPHDYQHDKIPIGYPVDNLKLYVLDKYQNIVPEGVIGELAISGIGLARSYKNLASLTNQKFVKNPFSQSKYDKKMYLTGDLVKQLAGGLYIYIGRKDEQVKINGNRIELSEIESLVLSHQSIEQVHVDVLSEGNTKKIAVYYVSKKQDKILDLRSFLATKLPAAVLPSYYIHLESIPVTVNGKVDKKALPKIDDSMLIKNEFIKAETNTEKILIDIWKDVLNISELGITDNFFELGGDSLTAMRVMSGIAKKLSINVQISDLFKYLTIRELALEIESNSNQNIKTIDIGKTTKQEYYKVSNAQKRLWVLDKFEGGSEAYHITSSQEINDEVDFKAIKMSMSDIIERHESLRTVFITVDSEPKQKILSHKELKFNPEYHDLSLEENSNELLNKYLIQNEIKRFDLENGPLLRMYVLKIRNDKFIVLFCIHHIISDGWSMNVLINDFYYFYNKHAFKQDEKLNELSIQYRDYTEWLDKELDKDNNNIHRDYWLKRFKDTLPTLELPIDNPRPIVQQFQGDRLSILFEEETVSILKNMSLEHNATMFMSMLAVLNAFLYKYTGQKDIIIGSPVSGRIHKDLEDQIGLFVNTLAYRNNINPKDSFKDFLNQVAQEAKMAADHEIYPFDLLLEDLNLKRDMSRSALFDVMISYTQIAGESDPDRRSLSEQFVVSKFDLEFEFFEMKNNQLQLDIIYDIELFENNSIKNLAKYFTNFLNSVTASNGRKSITDLDLITIDEEQELIRSNYRINGEYKKSETVIDLFNKQVIETPENIAVISQDKEMTYKELNDKSECLANYIQKEFNISSDEFIPILVSRNENMIVALLAVLKSGAAYVPIDSEYPSERISFILNEFTAKCVLSDMNHSHRIAEVSDVKTVNIEEFLSTKVTKLEQKELKLNSDDLAYMIYTSGSTGKPKGVLIEHHSLYNYTNTVVDYFNLTSQDVILQQASLTFDTSIEEIFPCLSVGATLVLSKDGGRNIEDITDLVKKHQITFLSTTPLVLNELNKNTEALNSVRIFISGGDKLQSSQINELYKCSDVYNTYGPTETTVCASYYKITELKDPIPIGNAINNTGILILNDHNKLNPKGIVGELCITGGGLARSYYNNKTEENEKFILNPYSKANIDKKLYKTGDLAILNSNGLIEYRGRIDDQVKIRGYRVEISEIEAALIKHDSITDSFVFTIGDEEKRLFAAISVNNIDLESKDIRLFLQNELPFYMIPSSYIFLTSLPQNTSGKVDTKKLIELAGNNLENEQNFVEAKTDTEKGLLKIWQETLKREKIGITDNFFEIGGNSISAVQIISKIHFEFGIKIELKTIFSGSTIKEISDEIDILNWVEKSDSENKDNEILI